MASFEATYVWHAGVPIELRVCICKLGFLQLEGQERLNLLVMIALWVSGEIWDSDPLSASQAEVIWSNFY